MHAMSLLSLLASALVLTSCATTSPGTPVAMGGGEIAGSEQALAQDLGGDLRLISLGRTSVATYSASFVAGTAVDLTFNGNGVWFGSLGGRNMSFVLSPARIYSGDVQLQVYRTEVDLSIRGTWFGRLLILTVTKDGISGMVDGGTCTFTLSNAGADEYSGSRTCLTALGGGVPATNPLRLIVSRDAKKMPDAAMPQYLLALLSILPI